ncbi:glycosyltransferase family 2 protein [Rhodobacteraceae bacterium NNCM2]|nr:glycosyltransferase family 2 protein [Coraliihabitans acroporae]
MTKCPISAFIIVKDEERRLPATLAALGWVDEIVVVDSGSTDRTVAIAEAAGARVLYNEWAGYGPQKVFAEAACKHDWVLNVDADEVVTPELAAEIRAYIESGQGGPAAFRMRILTVYPGDSRPRPLADDFNEIRFYHRSVAGYRDHAVFDRVVPVEGCEVRQLSAPLWHFTLVDWAQFVDKENRHSTFLAENDRGGRRFLKLRLGVELPLTFLKFYFLRRHVTGGWKGFFFALSAAYARTLRLAKILERQGEKVSHRSASKKSSEDND